jgi:hypothetical protein
MDKALRHQAEKVAADKAKDQRRAQKKKDRKVAKRL